MSFGFSPTDIVTLITFAVQVSQKYRKAPKDFGDLASDVETFEGFLTQLHEAIGEIDLNPQQAIIYEKLSRHSKNLLSEIDDFLIKYGSLKDATPRKRDKMWFPLEEAEKLKKHIYEHILLWTAHLTVIITTKNLEVTTKNLEMTTKLYHLEQRKLHVPHKNSDSKPISPENQDNIEWIDIEKSLELLKVSEPQLKEKVESIYRHSLSQGQLHLFANICTTHPEEDETVEFHDESIIEKVGKALSWSSSIESSETLQQAPTNADKTTDESQHGKYNFNLPPEPPLAFSPRRATKRSKSVPSKSADVVKNPTESRRKASLIPFHKMAQLGTSAPSITQQRSPFGAGFSPRAKVSRSISVQGGPVTCTNPRI